MTSRLSRLRRHTDDGVTLVELVVVMSILPIVLGLSSMALINAMHLSTKTQMRVDAQQQNRTGFELLTRLLRQATYPQQGTSANSTVITVADTTQLVFTSRLAGTSTVSQYKFSLVGTDLKWDYVGPSCATSPCTYATPASSALKRTLIRGVRDGTVCPGAATPVGIFRYYGLNPIDGSLQTTPLTAPVTGSNLANIAVVQITIYSKTRIGGDAPACEPVTGQVNLRNVNPQ
jgi:prepilin-type N-terminal cleavage/methylation domain-containing protein